MTETVAVPADAETTTEVAMPAPKPAKAPRKRAAVKPKPAQTKVQEIPADKPQTPVKSVPVELGYAETVANLQSRHSRLEGAWHDADADNDGPRANAIWRAQSRVKAQLNTLKMSKTYF